MRFIATDLWIAFRNILRHRHRTALALLAIAFGVTAYMLAAGFIEWSLWAGREWTIRSQLGHLQIVKPGYHEAGKADPHAYLLPEAVPRLDDAGGHIRAVAPRLSFSGLVSRGESTLSFIGEGVSPREEALFGDDALNIVAGRNLGAANPRTVILGEGLARNLGAGVGDRVVLLANTVSGGVNAVEVTVIGLFSTVTKAYDDAALRLPIATARELMRTRGSHAWIVLLDDTSHTDAVLARLRGQLAPAQYEIVPWYRLSDFYNKTVALFAKQIQGIRLIIALIILLSISNTMIMSVLERIGEIGTSMALGVRRRGILRLFLTEGALLGCLGGILGMLAGYLLAQVVSAIGIPMPPGPGMARGYIGEVKITGSIALVSLALAVLTTLLASVYPAWRASRMPVVDALRHNR